MHSKAMNLARTGVVGAMLLCVGCSVFEPREAQVPDTGGSPWQTPSVPTAVFLNLRTGLQDLTGVNYQRSLHPSFTYVPDPSTEAFVNDPCKWLNYNVNVEEQVIQRMLGEASNLTIVFTNTLLSDSGSFARFEGTYVMNVTGQATGLVQTFEGNAEYELTLGSGGWQLSKWIDTSWLENGNQSFGVQRATLRTDNPCN